MAAGRTSLFRQLMQTVQQAHWLNFVRLLGVAGFATAAGGINYAAIGKEPLRSGRGSSGPVTILGAGIAGLACEIFEASERVACLRSAIFNPEGMFCELGASWSTAITQTL